MIELIPVIILLIIYPFIVRLNVLPTPKGSLEFLTHPLGSSMGDFYFYEKVKVLLPIAFLLLIIFIFKKNKVRTLYYIGLGFYFIGITMSTILSPFLTIAIKGGGNRFEGYYVLLSYGILTLYLININLEKKRVAYLLNSLFIGGILVSIAGVTEFFGMSIYKIPILKRFAITNKEWIKDAVVPGGGYVSFVNVIKGSPKFHNVSATLGNSNYGGSFTALILGIVVVLFLWQRRKKTLLLLTTTYIVVFSYLVVSRSKAGLFAFGIGMIFLFVLKFRWIVTKLKKVLVLILLTIGIFNGVDILSGGAVGENIESAMKNETTNLREIKVEDDRLFITTYDGTVVVVDNGTEFEVFDEYTRPIKVENSRGRFFIDKKGFEEIYLTRDRKYENLFYINYYERGFPIVRKNNTYKTLNRSGKMIKISDVPRIRYLDKYQRRLSSRIYIWSRSIPLIEKAGMFGFGPDTYAIIYPHNDYFGKYLAFGDPYIFISKPHNMYLQMLLNTGVVTLVGFLLIVIPYFIQSIVLHINKEVETFIGVSSLGVFIGVLNYLIVGIINDSSVSTAPNFWMMLGLGIALNINLIEKRRKKRIERMKNRI